jgi:hypothetical protein
VALVGIIHQLAPKGLGLGPARAASRAPVGSVPPGAWRRVAAAPAVPPAAVQPSGSADQRISGSAVDGAPTHGGASRGQTRTTRGVNDPPQLAIGVSRALVCYVGTPVVAKEWRLKNFASPLKWLLNCGSRSGDAWLD